MVAKKTPAKKAAPAAKAPAKKTPPKVVRSSTEFAGPLDKSSTKAAMDARSRASKYGKVVGPTKAGQIGGGSLSRIQESTTTVKSSRGNMYLVEEDKTQRKFLPDSKKTTITPVAFSFKAKPKSAPKKKK